MLLLLLLIHVILELPPIVCVCVWGGGVCVQSLFCNAVFSIVLCFSF